MNFGKFVFENNFSSEAERLVEEQFLGSFFFSPGTILVLYNSNFPSDYRMGKEVMRSINEFNNAFLHSEVQSCTLCKAFGLFSIKVSMLDKILIQIVEKESQLCSPEHKQVFGSLGPLRNLLY